MSGSDFRIQCPFHEGDTNPSLGVNMSLGNEVPVGFYHCFGCGAKGGWNKLAGELGLALLDKEDFDDKSTFGAKSRVSDAEKRLLGEYIDPMPKTGTPFDGASWRGVSGKTVRRAGGVSAIDWKEKIVFLWLPVLVDGRAVMSVKARMKKIAGKPSYLWHDPMKLHNKPWYGYDMADALLKKTGRGKLFVVEGARDALKLMDNGLPSIALLGTRQWNERKMHQLLSMCQRRDAVPVIMMDSDSAGVKAQKLIKGELDRVSKNVQEVKLAVHARRMGMDELDPASLPKRFMAMLKKA